MRIHKFMVGGALGVVLGILVPVAGVAQLAGSPLAEAAGSVGGILGPQALSALVAVEGERGTPQPAAWRFTVADATSRNGVRVLDATVSRAMERAAPEAGYPMMVPGGFFNWADVRVDSFGAFSAADKVARVAMVGFDAVYYTLKARDGTRVPVWHLTLVDVEGRAVGRLEISAINGELERQIWMRYAGPGRRNLVRIEDSASPLPAMQPVVAPVMPVIPVVPGESVIPVVPPPLSVPGGPGTGPAVILPPVQDGVPSGSPLVPLTPSAPVVPPPTGGYEPLPPQCGGLPAAVCRLAARHNPSPRPSPRKRGEGAPWLGHWQFMSAEI